MLTISVIYLIENNISFSKQCVDLFLFYLILFELIFLFYLFILYVYLLNGIGIII